MYWGSWEAGCFGMRWGCRCKGLMVKILSCMLFDLDEGIGGIGRVDKRGLELGRSTLVE